MHPKNAPSMRSATPRRRRLRVRTIQVLPTLITAANLLAGLLALSYLQDASAAAGRGDWAAREAFVVRAAWLLFLGMGCDALDGRIARMTGTTSAFGAQLDSLADVVSFGVAPALLARSALGYAFPAVAGKVIVGLAVVYVVGAALRLARYNVESARTADDHGAEHVTLIFRGLPSPAAAGVIASLVILRHQYVHTLAWMDWALLAVTPLLGLFMVSRMPYSHVLNRYFDGSRPLQSVVGLVFLVFFVVSYFEETVAALFFLYAASGPMLTLYNRMTGRLAWVEQEEGDEDVAAPDWGDGVHELRPVPPERASGDEP